VLSYFLLFLSLHAGLCMDRQGPPTHTRVTRSQSRSAGDNADLPQESSESTAVSTSVPSSTSSSGAFAAHPLSTSAAPPSLSANVVSSTVSGSDQSLSPQYTAPLLRDSGVGHSVAFTDGVGSTSFFQSSIADDFVATRQSSAAPVVSSAFPSFSTPSAPSWSSRSAADAIRDLATRFAEFTSYFSAQLSRLQAATVLPTAPSAAVQSTHTPTALHAPFRPVAPDLPLLQSGGAAMPRLSHSKPGGDDPVTDCNATGPFATHARISSSFHLISSLRNRFFSGVRLLTLVSFSVRCLQLFFNFPSIAFLMNLLKTFSVFFSWICECFSGPERGFGITDC